MQLYTRSAGTGVPVVLLHAFPLSSAMWLAQREGLSASCQVITPDLRGFGGSRLGDDEPSIDLMADDVAALLDQEGIERAVVGGQSMGGYVTMAFCRRHPDRVAGVILADTKASQDTEQARENRERIARQVLADGTGVLVEEVLPGLLGQTTKERRAMVFGRVRGLVQSAPPGAVAWAQRAMAARARLLRHPRRAQGARAGDRGRGGPAHHARRRRGDAAGRTRRAADGRRAGRSPERGGAARGVQRGRGLVHQLRAWRGSTTSRMISAIAAATGMASRAPTMPSRAPPNSAAITVTAGATSTERFITRG
ncbi:pimeloyl-ACP methyl ester carboxylesterase [Nonomuraea dietziae]|uniref:Pimeloyl-ACP methyl ester carboxylesterase n=1 Tax=Nonomuraea dietziae TaxID=65515 RepID=A0A7W5V2S9_9ACTN|nr:pimeloyl-ACP methyl ester carboxylesterase [Nonomuraea dietziae]